MDKWNTTMTWVKLVIVQVKTDEERKQDSVVASGQELKDAMLPTGPELSLADVLPSKTLRNLLLVADEKLGH